MNLPAPRGEHPTQEEIDRMRRGPADASSENVRAHVALCSACTAEEYRLAEFEAAEPLSPRKGEAEWSRFGAPRLPRATSSYVPLAIAAGFVIAVFAGSVLIGRKAPVETVRSSKAPVLAGPEGLLSEPPRAFPNPGPGRRIFVFDDSRRYEWTSAEAAGSQVAFPEGERRKLQRGVDYNWCVLGDAGRTVGAGSAAATRFRLR